MERDAAFVGNGLEADPYEGRARRGVQAGLDGCAKRIPGKASERTVPGAAARRLRHARTGVHSSHCRKD